MNLLRALATFIVALMIMAVLALLTLGTPRGSAFLLDSLADLAGDRLTLTGVQGTLLEGLQVDRLQITAGRTTILIAPAELKMNWPDLLRRRIRLTTARTDTVQVDIAPRPPDAPDTPVQPLVLPLAIAADSLEIRRLLVRNGVEPGNAAAVANSTVEIGPVVLQGELVAGDLRFESLRAELYGVQLEARGVFGTGEPFALEGTVAWEAPEPAISGTGTVAGDLAALRVEQVVRLPTPVGVGGVLRLLQDQPELLAVARWTDFSRPLGTDPRLLLRSDAGRLRLKGWTDGYEAELEGDLRLGDWPRARARASAAGDTRALQIRELQLDGFGGQVTGAGTVALRDALSGQLRLQGRRIDPRFLDPRLAGTVDFGGQVRFDSSGDFQVELADASGTLFRRPLRASGTVARAGSLYTFDAVRINAGVNRVELDGQLGAKLAGRFRIDAPDLSTLWPGYRGQLRGTGTAGGTTAAPLLDLDLAGRDLTAGELRIGTLRARGGIAARQRLTVSAEADGLAWADRPLGRLVLGVDGPLPAHAVSVVFRGPDLDADLAASGSYRKGILTETIGSGAITLAGDQRWLLRTPATLQLKLPDTGVDAALTAHCWDSGDAELCLADGRLGAGAFSGALDLRRFPLANLARWLPPDVALEGTATAALKVQQQRGVMTGSLRSSVAGAAITWQIPDDEDVRTELTELRADADLDGDNLEFDAAVAGSFGLQVAARGQVSGVTGGAPRIAAGLTGGVPDLAALGPLLERFVDIGDVGGVIRLDAQLTGNARRPDIAGGLELEDGAFTVPDAGIRVDRIGLSLLGRPDGQVALAGYARSGKGYVALDGALAWRDRLTPTAEATVRGRVFDVINLKQGLVQVSPDVRVVLRDRQFRVSGSLLVPRAEVRLKKIAESAAQPSPDTIVHGREDLVVEKRPPLFVLDGLQVRLGEKVSFEGFGLKTRLAGSLVLNQSLGADPGLVTGEGVVTLREGQFNAFSQKLAIERGSLLFSGLVTDPGLDVKATRELEYEGRDIKVGVLLSGKLSRIETKIYSEPAMGELDALSYLTTGKPLSAAGAGDRTAVTNSAISLGLSQALPMVRQLGSALNVDEVALDQSEDGGTAVVVGEQLGKNLFIRYSYGIFDKLGKVTATYKLGRNVSIEGSSGDEQALDLIYSVTW